MSAFRIVALLLILAVAGPAAAWLQRPESPRPAKAVAGRYVLQDSGKTVLDRLTGLRWQQGFSGSTMNWNDAKAWCSNNTPALPGTGWRLPSRRELLTLVDTQTKNPAIDPIFTGTPSEYFWSATPWVSGGPAWYVDFYNGNSYAYDTSNTYWVRCVR